MDLGLRNKVVVLTGGSGGIGEDIVRVLCGEGANVAIVGRNETDNRTLQMEMEASGGRTFSVEAELSNPEDCENAMHIIIKEFGRIEGLVNNISVNDGVSAEKGKIDRFTKNLHNNLIHYYLMAHFALPYLKSSKGAIVNISYKTTETGQENGSARAVATGGQNALTREWAVELLKYGVRVNSVILAESLPLKNRMTNTADIAHMTAFLLSGKSSHTTGQLIHVDGGYVHPDRALANA